MEEEENEWEENEDGDIVDIKKKESSTDYSKLAKALGEIINQNIKVSLIDINESDFGFKPDVKNNQILFGMKALSNVGTPIIEKIIAGRPYHNLKDFMSRCVLNKTAMINLIKGGAFDKLCESWAKELYVKPRILAMVYYLSIASEPKTKLNLQNFNGLIQKNLIPPELSLQQRIFYFNKALKANKKGIYYIIPNNDKILDFYKDIYDEDELEIIQGSICIKQKTWDKKYDSYMDIVRSWLKENQEEMLIAYNNVLFKETWDKYAQGTISAWEMAALCFYYHEHELANVNNQKYGIKDFKKLQSEEINCYFVRNGKQIPIYKLYRIAGTVISKNDPRHSISLLTTTGVVNVKFTKEYYALFNKQISELQQDGTKKVREKGWFTRGTKLIVQGFRREDTFVAKNYKGSNGHQLYKIVNVNGTDLELTHERYGQANG